MHVEELIGIAVANADGERVTVGPLEPATVATEAVSGLAQLVAELVDNAVAFSEPGEAVEVTGGFVGDDYVVSVADRGVGMSPHLLNALNHVLDDPRVHFGGPEPRLGIQLVARLAARHGMGVELISTSPGTTARTTVPSHLVSRVDRAGSAPKSVFADTSSPAREMAQVGAPRPVSTAGVGRTIDLTKYGSVPQPDSGSEGGETDVERFLETIFGPLRGHPLPIERSETPHAAPAGSPQGEGRATTLQVRIPGENFSITEDERSTAAGEGAVDIRKALSSYDEGRKSADESEPDN